MSYPEGEHRKPTHTNTGRGEWRVEKETPVHIDQFGRRTRAWNNRLSFTEEEWAQAKERLVYNDQFGRRTRLVEDVPQRPQGERSKGIVKRTVNKLFGR